MELWNSVLFSLLMLDINYYKLWRRQILLKNMELIMLKKYLSSINNDEIKINIQILNAIIIKNIFF
jgi:hypothetical protein